MLWFSAAANVNCLQGELTLACRLCGSEAHLEVSHIIPSFIYKWLKDTSATGFMRSGLEPNRRIQDGFKEEFLCPACEDLLCVWETEFSKRVFHPLVSGSADKFRYEEWMLKFSVSLSWRVLKYILEKHGVSHLNDEMASEAQKALECWQLFLLDKEPHPDKFQQHVIPLDHIASATRPLPTNINRYLLRSIDLDVVASDKQSYVYTKLPHFLIIGFIHIDQPNHWKGTKLHVKNGVLGNDEYILPDYILDHLIGKSESAEEITGKYSDKQTKKIEDSARKDIDRVANSETFKALQGDVQLHGRKAFKRENN